MRKVFYALAATAISLAALISCEKYDDSQLRSEVDALKEKVDALQKSVDAYKLLVEKSRLIESIVDNGDGSFTISFVDGTNPIVIATQSGQQGEVDAFFQSVVYDAENETLTLVLTDGQTVVINLRQPGPGGPGGEDGPGGPGGGGQQEGITPVDRTGTWNASLYDNSGTIWIYVASVTGNFSYYAVKEDSGDFTSATFIKGILEEFQEGLTAAIAANGGLTVHTQYSYDAYDVYSNDGYTAACGYTAIRDEGDGKYKIVMIGVDSDGKVTGEYLVIGGNYTKGQAVDPGQTANPQDDLTYAVTNMAGTWDVLYWTDYEYVYKPIDGSWFAFYAVPSSLDLTDTAVVGPILKEFESLIQANYAGKTVTPVANYQTAARGSFNVYAMSQAAFGDYSTWIPAQEGASGELKVLLIGLKSDLSVSGRYVECRGGTITR